MHRYIARLVVTAATCLLAGATAPRALQAQSPAAPSAADTASRELRVFLDCESFGCRLDYFITEVAFATWVRDRLVADVHLQVTTLETGSGGRAYTLFFIGRDRFAGWVDTLQVETPPNVSEDDARARLARAFRAGLVRYALRTPAGARLTVAYEAPAGGVATSQPAADPWNFWTYRPSVRGFTNGQSQQAFLNLNSNFSADRVTEMWKVNLNLDGNYNRSRFTFDQGDGSGERTSIFTRRGYSTSGRAVRTLGGQWSAGVSGGVGRSDFRNHRVAARLGPTIEWNRFAWREATRRQLTFAYSPRVHHFAYDEVTLYGELAETRASHVAVAALDLRQRWGTIEMSAQGSQYLHDPQLYNVGVETEMEIRLFKGLALNLDGRVARVRDQLYLPGAGLTRDEVLLQQRALATNYEYFAFVGISYTFGSIYNSVVNPRLNALESAQ